MPQPLNLIDVQPVCVPLHTEYQHRFTSDNQESETGFVGRSELIADIVTALKQTRTSRGCYLVAGYRGAGKTSLVNRALHFYSGKKQVPDWVKGGLSRQEGRGKLYNLFSHIQYSVFLFVARARLNRYRSVSPAVTSLLFGFLSGAARYFHNIWEIFIGPNIITVRINLGNDRALEPDKVMYNIATLLDETFHRSKRLAFWRFIQRGLVLLVALITLYMVYTNRPHLDISLGINNSNLVTFLLQVIVAYFFITKLLSWLEWWPAGISTKLRYLTLRVKYTLELSSRMTGGFFSFSGKRHNTPLNAAQIEAELLNILEDIREIPRLLGQPDVIFIFDELDKIRGVEEISEDCYGSGEEATSFIKSAAQRKARVENLLGAIKNFINTGEARFFFIAGREILDSYQAERGSTSSLYESLFNKIFEVNSLLTDSSDDEKFRLSSLMETYLCRRLLAPDVATYIWLISQYNDHDRTGKGFDFNVSTLMHEPFRLSVYYNYLLYSGIDPVEARRIILCMRNFVSFLTVHSWGNCKRMTSLFEHFLKPRDMTDSRTKAIQERIMRGSTKQKKPGYISSFIINRLFAQPFSVSLQFGIIDQQRILLAGNLSILLHHHLSRQLSASGDKLVVSTFVTLQYILKFHRLPFSRSQLERMDEVLNIYRSPDINSVTDTLLSKILRLYCRRVRNSFYRYRFNSGFEQELRYISRVSDIESAAFNFSLDSSSSVKQYYRERIENIRKSRGDVVDCAPQCSDTLFVDYYLALGDIFLGEQSHELAIECFQLAIDISRADINAGSSVTAEKRVLQLIEALLKLGDVNERRQRYERSAVAYISAINFLDNKASSPPLLCDVIRLSDSKWDILRQPFWALMYLNLKRSPLPWREELITLDKALDRDDFVGPIQPGKVRETGSHTENIFCRTYQWLKRSDKNQFYYRLGKSALFFESPDMAVKYLAKCLTDISAGKINNERQAYLRGIAGAAFSEAVLLGLIGPKVTTSHTGILINHLHRFIDNPENGKDSHITLKSLSDKPTSKSIRDLQKMLAEPGAKINFCPIEAVLGIVIEGARVYERFSLYSQAAYLFLNVLNLLSLLAEIVAITYELDEINETRLPSVDDDTEYKSKLNDINRWMDDTKELRSQIGWRALKNLSYSHGRAHFHFIDFYVKKDLKLIKIPNQDNTPTTSYGPLKEHYLSFADNCNRNNPDAEYLSDLPFFISNLCNSEDRNTDLYQETAFWQHSLIAQKLGFVSVWHEVARTRIEDKQSTKPNTQQKDFEKIELKHLSPFSARSMIFGHWLSGMQASREFKKLTRFHEKVVFSQGAKGLYHFYRALHYIRQISGNDQEIMFPPPGLIMFHMWRFLYHIFIFKKNRGPGADGTGQWGSDPYPLIASISENLKVHTGNEIQDCFLDFAYVSERTLRYMHDIESVDDLSGRARHEILKTKFYLSDDYEDSRFNHDWAALHLLSPTASLIRRHITAITQREKINIRD